MTTTSTSIHSASPTKLRDGSWGAKVATADIAVGNHVQITTRAGKTWVATVERVVCSGEGYAIVATVSASTPTRSSAVGRSWNPDKFNGYGRRKGGYSRDCATGGNCSSMGSGRSCGAHDCDGY